MWARGDAAARRLTRATGALLAVTVSLGVPPAAGAQDLETGVFVGTADGPQEVGVYAERSNGGRLRLARGTLDDVQTVRGELRLICNLPQWRVRGVFLSTSRLLRDDSAERRVLPMQTRRLTMSGMLVRVPASSDPVKWQRLLDDVGASPDNPAYVFVTVESGGMVRDFVVGVETDR